MVTFIQHRELLIELTKREIKQRYKQSVLGYAWVILTPLAQMVVLAFVFSKILPVQNMAVPYPIFLYIGLLPWTLLTGSLTASANSFIGNAGLLTKIALPRAVFVQSTVLAKMVDFFLASTVLGVFLWVFEVPLSASMLWFFPLFAMQSLFTYALSLLIATLNLFYRDIQYLLNFVLMIWMYLTPVIYPPSFFPTEYQWVFAFNPMAIYISSYRQIVVGEASLPWFDLGLSLVLSCLLFFVAQWVFSQLEGRFSDAL